MNWEIIAAISIPLAGFLFAMYRWLVGAAEKRENQRERRWAEHLEQEEAKHNEHEKRWRQHSEQFIRYEKRIAENERDISGTREELHRDYVREDQLKEFRGELRENINNIFTKLNSMSRDLNQVIGELKARANGHQ
ncbi:MAG: hypothetical protein AB2604_10670 [Candidatus Thiodiazotropha taylori]